jgi:hypothetical protein
MHTEREVPAIGPGRPEIPCRAGALMQIKRLGADIELASFHTGEIEQITKQPIEQAARLADCSGHTPRFFRHTRMGQQVREAKNARQWRAYLVA